MFDPRPLLAPLRDHDRDTALHCERVVSYAVVLAAAVGGIPLRKVWAAALVHDVGKTAVPEQILSKPGRLTAAETRMVEMHPAAGERILRRVTADAVVLAGVRSHHERWDGAGYPDRLRGDEIPPVARILAVADTLDAMGAARPYRPGLPWEVIEAEILRCSCTQFDPAVVAAFHAVRDPLAEIHGGALPICAAA